MLIAQIALVPESEFLLEMSNLTRVAAALQKQVTRDFNQFWNVDGTVDAFPRIADVPLGYWPIIIVNPDFPVDGLGFHPDVLGQPLALVRFTENWSLTASHECLEMLADPFGNRLVPSYSLPSDPMPRAQGLDRVSYLVEVCDPCESVECAYTVNGVLVSDFYTPRYFDPVPDATPIQGVRYDYTGKITRPRQVLRGGYLSWIEPRDNTIRQALRRDEELTFRNIGTFTGQRNLREAVDSQTPLPPETRGLSPYNKWLQEAQQKWKIEEYASSPRAEEWSTELLLRLCATL